MTNPPPMTTAAAKSHDMTDHDLENVITTGGIAAPVVQIIDLHPRS